MTGIRTTTSSRRTSNYARDTVASTARKAETSPYVNVTVSSRKATPLRILEPTYANVGRGQKIERKVSQKAEENPGQKVERRPSNNRAKVEHRPSINRDLGPKSSDMKSDKVRRSISNGKDKERKQGVRRNGSNPTKIRRERRRAERRHLTIAYPGEVRSPLKERQNFPANVKRSNSDQAPSKKEPSATRSQMNSENNDYVNVVVDRKHSLRSDVLMSPQVKIPGKYKDVGTPTEKVRRAMSERSTPRSTPYIKVSMHSPRLTPMRPKHLGGEMNRPLQSCRTSESSPRRSPRLAQLGEK